MIMLNILDNPTGPGSSWEASLLLRTKLVLGDHFTFLFHEFLINQLYLWLPL